MDGKKILKLFATSIPNLKTSCIIGQRMFWIIIHETYRELEKCQELLQETKKQFEDEKQSKSKRKNEQKRIELKQEQLTNKIEEEKYRVKYFQTGYMTTVY